MSILQAEYEDRKKDALKDEFVQEVHEPIKEFVISQPDLLLLLEEPGSHKLLANFVALNITDNSSDITVIYYSCIYGVAAMVALDQQKPDLSWELMYMAALYCGHAMASKRTYIRTVQEITRLHDVEKQSEKGKRRHKTTEEIKAKVYEFAKTRESWVSQGDLVAKAMEFVTQSPHNHRVAKETVERWIKEWPERLQRIPALRARIEAGLSGKSS